jgi:hypothetical protein
MTNPDPDLGNTVGERFGMPGVAGSVSPEEICASARDVNQDPAIHIVILAEMAFRLPKYVVAPGFINCNRRHSGGAERP